MTTMEKRAAVLLLALTGLALVLPIPAQISVKEDMVGQTPHGEHPVAGWAAKRQEFLVRYRGFAMEVLAGRCTIDEAAEQARHYCEKSYPFFLKSMQYTHFAGNLQAKIVQNLLMEMEQIEECELDGHWRVVATERAGQAAAFPWALLDWSMAEGMVRLRSAASAEQPMRLAYKLFLTKQLKELELTPQDGPDAGKVLRVPYRIHKKKLELWLPDQFTSVGDQTGERWQTFERVLPGQ